MAEIISFPVPARKQVEENLKNIEAKILHDDPQVQALWRRLVREYFARQIEISSYSINVTLSGTFTESELKSNSEAIRRAVREHEIKVLAPINVEVIQLIREIAELRVGRQPPQSIE